MGSHLAYCKHSHYGLQAPHGLTTTYSETDIPASRPSPGYGQQMPQGDQSIQTLTGTKRSQENTDNSLLDFAPFIAPDPSQLDYIPTIYDSLLSPTAFDWAMADMWMPNFDLDPGTLADLMESDQEPDVN